MNRIFNIFVNKIVNILIIIILILTAFFIGLNSANAETIPATMWGLELQNHINTLTSTTSYVYEEYDPDETRNFVYKWSNEHFFDNTYEHQKEFYRDYNYVVMAYSETTLRVFVQNINRVIAYQGFNTLPVEPYYYFANMTVAWRAGSTTYWTTGVNAIYSYYIDINYNTKSYTFSGNPLTDLNFYLLGTDYHYKDSGYPFGSTDIDMKLFDSFNGNFAWIETWNELENTEALWIQASGYTDSYSTSGYFNSIVDFPELPYVSSGAPDYGSDNPGNEESDSGILDGINKIYDWLNGSFNGYDDYSGFFDNFGTTDNGGISRVITSPLGLIRGLLNSNNLCSDLRIDFAFLGKEKITILPSGCLLWSRVPTPVITLWHTLLVGLFGYRALIDLFHVLERLKHPEESKVDTLDL